MAKRKTQVWYMHTLEGKPASYNARLRYVFFCGGRTLVQLVPTLYRIRQEQRRAMREAYDCGQLEWSESKRYGYVRVQLPEPSSNG